MKNKEIERKFLLNDETWKHEQIISDIDITQIYFKKSLGFTSFLQKKESGDIIVSIKREKFNLLLVLDEKSKNIILSQKEIVFDENGIFELDENKKWAIRVRSSIEYKINNMNTSYELTIKGPTLGISKFEINISTSDYVFLSALKYVEGQNIPFISKNRKTIKNDEKTIWEIDTFNFPVSYKGLVLAEIELPSESYHFKKPNWLGKEVTYDQNFTNSNMV